MVSLPLMGEGHGSILDGHLAGCGILGRVSLHRPAESVPIARGCIKTTSKEENKIGEGGEGATLGEFISHAQRRSAEGAVCCFGGGRGPPPFLLFPAVR